VAQAGDFTSRDGSGGKPAVKSGRPFRDEKFFLRHDRRGVLSMASTGKNKNGSQFFVTLRAAPELDWSHVVFGEVVDGWEVLDKMEAVGTPGGRPASYVQIVDAGVLEE